MVDCRPKLVTLALFWLIAFLVSLSIYVVSLFAFIETTCTIREAGRTDMNMCGNQEECRYLVPVTFQSVQTGEELRAIAETECFDCVERIKEEFKQEFSVNSEVPCWYQEKDTRNVRLPFNDHREIDEQTSVLATLSRVLLTVTIIFAIFFFVVMIRIFETELIRVCPRFILTAWVNLPSIHLRRRSSSGVSSPPGQAPEDFVSPPPAVASRRRISKLIEGSKLSTSEAKALRENGWSCCICLEEKDDDEQRRPVARLKCNHATHSECLRLWLETGRAACCLCNADVFSDGTKEPSLSSQASSTSGGDAGLIGSLVVERTDRTPSSPGTSVFIDASQPYSDTAPSNDERDVDIESGV